MAKTNKAKLILLSKCAVYDSKKSRFIKKQEATRLLSGLGFRRPLRKISLLGGISFCRYKITETMNSFLLAGGEFMPEMHLRQTRFAYSACEQISKNKTRIQKYKETGDSR